METIELRNGVVMPIIGYGVYQVDPSECELCVSNALKVGYRMIDTAQAYHNEDGVGAAISKSEIARKDIFIVSKVWISDYGYEKAKVSIDVSLRKLGTDYIDLMFSINPSATVTVLTVRLRKLTKMGNSEPLELATFIRIIL